MIKISEHKEPQHNLKSEYFLTPKKLYLPLSQHTGSPSSPCIQKGNIVEEASLIAKESGFISAQLHAPSAGKILAIDNWFHPILKRAQAIFIECQNSTKEYPSRKNTALLTKNELVEIVKTNGIVGLGGAAFPTHVKLNPPKPIETLIINGCECEPYLATDYRLMLENIDEIFKGIEIIYKILEPKKIIFAIEKNKPAAIKKINLVINTKRIKLPSIKIIILPVSYPQGSEKQLIYSAVRKRVPPKKLPLDIGCLVQNVATCFAIYEAVYFNKPLTKRLVSFCGDALVSSKNIWVKVGTLLQELFDEKILEFKNEPKKIISGGPMMGVALDSLNYPILKGTGGFLFLNESAKTLNEDVCIRCARCVDSCPMKLSPLEYVKKVKKEEYDLLEQLHLVDCMECGSCAYVCPAKIPIVHYIKIGKKYASNG